MRAPIATVVLILIPFLLTLPASSEEQPASKDGKSVPMQKAPEKIDTGTSKAQGHGSKTEETERPKQEQP